MNTGIVMEQTMSHMTMKKINKCPYCGSDYYYIKSIQRGVVETFKSFKNNREIKKLNIDKYKCLVPVYISDYIYCGKCNKRICKIDEYNK